MCIRNSCRVFFALLIITILFPAGPAAETHEQDAPAEMQSSPSEMDAEMMDRYRAYATPGESHKVLHSLAGSWDYTIKFWDSSEGEPEISQGTSTIELILDERFLMQKAEGSAMGMPFEGMGITGFNNETQRYESVWIDNMGTGMMKGSGVYDPDMNAIIEDGSFSCPLEGGDKPYRSIVRITDDDSFTYEWYIDDAEGERFRAMEIVYTRKQ